MTDHLDALRDALAAARPAMTNEQQTVADALLATLTPRMAEPTWPGAPVIAVCGITRARERLHTRRNDGPKSGWECPYSCTATEWDRLLNPRPLTPAEHAEYGIPAPCCAGTDEKTTQRAEGTTP